MTRTGQSRSARGSRQNLAGFYRCLGQVTANLGQGAGLRILTGPVTSPTLLDQLKTLLAKYPQAKWIQYSPVERRNTLAGTKLAFGRLTIPYTTSHKADVVLSLDCDFLFTEPGHLAL